MTSAVAINRHHRQPLPKALSATDRKRIAAICADPRLPEEIERRRLGVAITPDSVSARDLIKTLATLADKLEKAGDALESLPTTARALLQEKLGGTQAHQVDLAMTLRNVAARARQASARVAPKAGPLVDGRVVYAVECARELCKGLRLPMGNVPDLASLILGTEISTDACKRALRRVRKPA